MEARGFLFAAPIAYRLGAGCVPFRKPGKLPYETVDHTYDLEYGTDTLSAHVDAIRPVRGCSSSTTCWPPGAPRRGVRPGRAASAARSSACAFLLELGFLSGRGRLEGRQVTERARHLTVLSSGRERCRQ